MGAVVVAGRYVPRPPDDNIWNSRPRGITVLYEVAPPVVLPFRPKYPLSQNDPGVWSNPTQSAFDTLTQTLQLYAPAPARNPPYSEDSVWQGKSVVNVLILSAPAAAPFTPKYWKFYDEASHFVVESTPVPPVLKLVGGNLPFKATFYKNNYDDASSWQNKSFGPSLVLELASNLPVSRPPYWQYNNDDSPVWRAASQSVNRVVDLIVVTPLVPTRWKLDYDDRSVWSGEPSNISLVYLPIQAPFVAKFWKQDYNDDRTIWVVKSSKQPIVQGLVIVTPLTPSQWNNDYNELPLWTVVSLPSNLLTGLPPPPPPPVDQGFGGKTWQDQWNKEFNRYLEKERVDVKASAAILSSVGGLARAKSLSSKQRSAIASLAAKARWK